jgi:hypothetical protein
MAASKFRYTDGIDADALPLPNVEQARLPIQGVEPQEMKPAPKTYRDYSEMPAFSWTTK